MRPESINTLKIRHFISLLIYLTLISSACSTGIESTGRITPTRDDRRLLQRTAEDEFADSLGMESLGQWMPGKRFLITDNRAKLLYDISNAEGRRLHADSIAGDTVQYAGTGEQTSPAGEVSGTVTFIDPDNGTRLSYVTRKAPAELASMTCSDFPMLIDLDMCGRADNLLRGRKLWIRTALWYDADGTPLRGAKFIPVTILEVKPGDSAFPLTVTFTDGNRVASLPMSISDGRMTKVSRSFQSLFSLSDPKNLYPAIEKDVWDLICKGRVREGMTKEECKLSLGNPKEVEHGHNWDNLVDYWIYDDGTYLLFIDDVLTSNRKRN